MEDTIIYHSKAKQKFNPILSKVILIGILFNKNFITTITAFLVHTKKWKKKSYAITRPMAYIKTNTINMHSKLFSTTERLIQIQENSAIGVDVDNFTTDIDGILESSFNDIENDNELKLTSNNFIQKQHYAAVLNISYDGINYYGWSSANDDIAHNKKNDLKRRRSKPRRGKYYGHPSSIKSIQGTLQNALSKLYGNVPTNTIEIRGCSRTDKGVHAKSYICTFQNSDKEIPFSGDLSKLVYVMNRMLPDDIRVQSASYLPYDAFHPTVDALFKTYEYRFSIGRVHDPLTCRNTWHVPSSSNNFDVSTVRECSTILKGVHNYTAFQGAFRGSDRVKKHKINPVCNITQIDIQSMNNHHMNSFHSHHSTQTYKVTITGSRFLYKMIRFIIGTLVSIGYGAINIEDVMFALDYGVRNDNVTKYVKCAPSHGLTLIDVYYDTNYSSGNCTDDNLFTWCT